VDPYAKPKERRVGELRPKIAHLPDSAERRTRRERQKEKEAVAAERRAIKKAARRHLKQQLVEELEEGDQGRSSL
jgi:enoyl-CoA hydratase/carnithine racemase